MSSNFIPKDLRGLVDPLPYLRPCVRTSGKSYIEVGGPEGPLGGLSNLEDILKYFQEESNFR